MKRIDAPISWTQLRARLRKVLATGRAFLILSFCSMAVFILLGLAGMLQQSYAVSPSQSMKGFAAAVSGRFFESLLGMELPHMKTDPQNSPVQAGRMAAFLIRFLTDLNPDDPRSLLALEMPGMSQDRSVLLRPGSGGEAQAPEDHGPLSGDEAAGTPEPGPDGPSAQAQHPDANADPNPNPASPSPDLTQPTADEDADESPEPPSPAKAADRDTGDRKVVFVYHSHNRESYYPELKAGAKDANSDKINVTLVGKRLADQLESRGIGAAHSNKDYPSTIKAYNWNNSYKYSLQTVRQALADNGNLKFFFDIHRDSQRRAKTTATIGGKDYAQVYFIIGHKNPNWKKNEAFANEIHERLEKQYPGLSRGIWGKTAATGNGEYNQSVAEDSVLIEIGGVDNTLKECYRTADALAAIIADLYWESQDAEKVSGSAIGN